jgi:diguanylate cyclase (GGDEF)-like protein
MLKLSDIANNLDDLIVVKDSNGEVIYNNKPYDSFVDAVKNSYNGEIKIENKNTWYSIVTKNFNIEGKKYTISIIKDITSFKEKERLLLQQGISNELTGLYNRQGIICNLNQLTKNFKESQKPFTVIMGDIDFFKKINDEYGHLAGDEILSTIGFMLKTSLRKDDFVGRYGGEEFIIVLSNQDISQILPRIEDIRSEIENHTFLYKDTPIKLTMTFGIQTYDGTKCMMDVIEEADKALYYGKENGRNQIVFYKDIENKLE